MQIKYKLVSGGDYTLLFDQSAGDALEKFTPTFRDGLYSPPGYGAPNQPRVPTGNTVGTLALRVASNYATAAAASAAIATIRAALKGVKVHLQVINGATTVYFPNASLTNSSHDQHGKECLHSLNFECDDITTVAP